MSPNTVPFYIKAYVRRRNRYCSAHISESRHPYCDDCKAIQHKPTLTINQVINSEQLDYAAYLEYQLASYNMTLVQARYAYLERYPECNCITGKNSVLSLILPYHDTILGDIPKSPIRKESVYA